MAAGSPQTVDRIQVEIAFNSEGVNAELSAINSSVDTTKGKLTKLETTSCSTADCFKTLEKSTSKAQSEFEKFPNAVRDSENALKGIDHTEKIFSKTTAETANAVDDTSSALEQAQEVTKEFKDKVTELTKPVENVRGGVEQLSKALKFSGVAAAASVAFSVIKGLIDEAREKVHQTYTAITDLETQLSSFTGKALSDADKAFAESYASRIEDANAFADLTTLVNATLPSATQTVKEEIIVKYNTAGEGRGINPATLYKAVFQAMRDADINPAENTEQLLNILDTAAKVSDDTRVDIVELLKVVKENISSLKDTGLSIADLIVAGGISYTLETDLDDFGLQLQDLSKKTTSAYEEVIAKYAKEAGYEGTDYEGWLSTQSEETQNTIKSEAQTAAQTIGNLMGDEIRKGFENIDLSGIETAITDQKILSLSSEELTKRAEANAAVARTNLNGKDSQNWGVFDLQEQVNISADDATRQLLQAYEAKKISDSEYLDRLEKINKAREIAQANIWGGLFTGDTSIFADNGKRGQDYFDHAYKIQSDNLGEAVAAQIEWNTNLEVIEDQNKILGKLVETLINGEKQETPAVETKEEFYQSVTFDDGTIQQITAPLNELNDTLSETLGDTQIEVPEPVDYSDPLNAINNNLTDIRWDLANKNTTINVYQTITAPTAIDSYTIQNAAKQGVYTAQVAAYNLR